MATTPERMLVPDIVGEIVGWRAWDTVGSERCPRLQSVSWKQAIGSDPAASIWPTRRWFYAQCRRDHPEGIPGEGCHCGLYAAASLEQLLTQHRHLRRR